jgi:hypothetical protein
MKCDVCSKESEFEAAFTKQYRFLHRSDLNLCPTCWVRHNRTSAGWYQIAVIVGGIVGYVLLQLNPVSVPGWVLTRIFLANIFLILTIVPHELGHVIAGRLVGWRVFAAVIGMGKKILKFKLFGIIFVFNWLPVGGITRLAPVDTKWYRTKRCITLLAGPAVNAAIAAIIFLIWRDSWREFGFWGVPRAARFCFLTNLFVMVTNLWPYRLKGSTGTDGKQLLETFSKKQEHVESSLAGRFALEAVIRRDEYKDTEGALKWCNDGLALFPQDFTLLTIGGSLCLDQQNYIRAREIFLKLLPSEAKPDRKRYMITNNIAYADALIGDPALLPEADTFSKEAFAGIPWVPAIVGTRGAVLVEMGQFEAGVKLLKESFEKHRHPRGKALNACHLTIAYCRMGDWEQAENYLKLARQFDPQCQLIGRAENHLNAVPSTSELNPSGTTPSRA